MKLAEIKWKKCDDNKANVLVIKPTLIARLLGKEIPIFEKSIYKKNKKVQINV